MTQDVRAALERIAELAHDRSTGPAVPDALWEIRGMAYEALAAPPVQSDAAIPSNPGELNNAGDEPKEILASRLIDAWCADKGRQIPWAKAIQIAAIVTQQPDAERDRLLKMGDEDGACGMCGRTDAPPVQSDYKLVPVEQALKCYSFNGETYTLDFESVLDDMRETDTLTVGLTYYEADAKQFNPSDFLSEFAAENLLESMSEHAWEEAGEIAEGWPSVDPARQAELQKIIANWVDKNLDCHFFLAINPAQREISADDLAQEKEPS